ncbi:MAG TPA: M56 family metallopeptidase, partial [Pirellulales bacterium]|nr:M56 family metallopeptidase [Pirellulales bacterium]
MNLRLFESLPSEPFVRMALVLLHSIWQASLLAALLWLALRVFAADHPQARYRLSVAALAIVVGMAVFTWSFLGRPATAEVLGSAAPGSETLASSSPRATPSRSPGEPIMSRRGHETPADGLTDRPLLRAASPAAKNAGFSWQRWPHALVAIWAAGAGFMLLRVLLAVRAGRRMVRSARPLETFLDAGPLAELVAELRQRLGLWRRVQVKVCDGIDVPAVLGAFWPVLLVPPAFVAGLPVDQLRIILTHELAHIRRYDYLVNLGQLLVEAGLFFNPAVWWISRRIRIEREACCDAFAVSLTGQPLAAARTLVDCAASAVGESLLGGGGRRGTMPAWSATAQAYDGRAPQGTLWERVRRIVAPQEIPQVRLPWYSLAGLLVGGSALLVGLEQGGELALWAADRWLTPKQRVEKLAEIENDYAQPSEAPKQPPPNYRIDGVVRMADGSPLPEKANLHASVLRPGYSGTDYLPLDAGGRFAKEFGAERVYLHLRAPGFATTFAGPFDAVDGDVRGVEVILEQGFSTRIRFVNDVGEGAPGVVLKQIQYRLPNRGRNGWTGYHHPQPDERLKSDADGYVTLNGCSDWPVTIDVRGVGYQFERSEHRLQPDATLVWKLKRARPTNGRV